MKTTTFTKFKTRCKTKNKDKILRMVLDTIFLNCQKRALYWPHPRISSPGQIREPIIWIKVRKTFYFNALMMANLPTKALDIRAKHIRAQIKDVRNWSKIKSSPKRMIMILTSLVVVKISMTIPHVICQELKQLILTDRTSILERNWPQTSLLTWLSANKCPSSTPKIVSKSSQIWALRIKLMERWGPEWSTGWLRCLPISNVTIRLSSWRLLSLTGSLKTPRSSSPSMTFM